MTAHDVQGDQLQLHEPELPPAWLQLLVDISTPAEVLTAVEEAAAAHFKANPTEFTGNKMVIANVATDPLKYMLCVWWEYAYPGEHAGSHGDQCDGHKAHRRQRGAQLLACSAGTELGRMGKARSGLYLCLSKCFTKHNVAYTLPPYPVNLQGHSSNAERPRGEGSLFMPPFMQKGSLKL